MIQKSTSLKYEPSSELLLNTAKQLFLDRELYRSVQLSVEDFVVHRVTRVQVSGFTLRVQGSGFMVQGSGFRVQGSGFRIQDSGYRVQGSGYRVQGSGWHLPVLGENRLFHRLYMYHTPPDPGERQYKSRT